MEGSSLAVGDLRLELVHDFDAAVHERIVAIGQHRGCLFLATDRCLYRIENAEDAQKVIIRAIKTLNYAEICEALE